MYIDHGITVHLNHLPKCGSIIFFPSKEMRDQCQLQWASLAMNVRFKGVIFNSKRKNDVHDFIVTVTRKKRRSLLMAVYRDTAAEGVDFPPECTRMIFLSGVPNPNIKNNWVAAKKNYEEQSGNGSWYNKQAAMAVQQVRNFVCVAVGSARRVNDLHIVGNRTMRSE